MAVRSCENNQQQPTEQSGSKLYPSIVAQRFCPDWLPDPTVSGSHWNRPEANRIIQYSASRTNRNILMARHYRKPSSVAPRSGRKQLLWLATRLNLAMQSRRAETGSRSSSLFKKNWLPQPRQPANNHYRPWQVPKKYRCRLLFVTCCCSRIKWRIGCEWQYDPARTISNNQRNSPAANCILR